MSIGMSQDTQHWKEMVALDPGLSPNTAKIKALFDAFPVVTVWNLPKEGILSFFSQIAIQLCLLGWLFMADILDNPYGYNIEYDENLEEVCSPSPPPPFSLQKWSYKNGLNHL